MADFNLDFVGPAARLALAAAKRAETAAGSAGGAAAAIVEPLVAAANGAAQRAEDAADDVSDVRDAIIGSTGTRSVLGRPLGATLLAGSAVGSANYVLAQALAADQYLEYLEIYNPGSAGPVKLRREAKSGDNFTQVGDVLTVNLPIANAFNRVDYKDFGAWKALMGERIGIVARVGGVSRMSFVSGAGDSGGYFDSGSGGDTGNFTDAGALTNNQLQVRYGLITALPQEGLIGEVADHEDRIAALEEGSGGAAGAVKSILRLPDNEKTFLSAGIITGSLPYGQSLSVGAQGQPAITLARPAYSKNITFVGGTKSTSTTDKASFVALFENNLGENNATGSNRGETISSGMANYAAKLALEEDGIDPTSFVTFCSTAGQGGTQLSSLVKPSSTYNRLIAQVTSANANAIALGKKLVVTDLPILQGESDCDNGTTFNAYLAMLLQFPLDLTADIQAITGQTTPVRLILYQTAYKAVTSAGVIALAQMEAVRQSPYIHFGTPIYHVGYNADRTHLGGASQYKWVGYLFGRARKQLVVENRVPDCIWPLAAKVVGTTVTLELRTPTPLVIDVTTLAATTDRGFKIVDDTGTLTLSNILVVDETKVQFTINRALGANPKLRYALDYQASSKIMGGATGNLRDSTPDTVTIESVVYPLYHVCPAFELPIYDLSGS